MVLRQVGRAAVLILLLTAFAMPAGARVEGMEQSVERGGWGWIWTAVVEWVAKLGSEMDPNGVPAPASGDGSGEGDGRSELGSDMDPNDRM